MNFFVDFESNNYLDRETNSRTYEIISIGIKDELGNEYYSLVKPHHRVTSFITSLTHITNEMLKDAPSLTTVLEEVSEFVSTKPHDTGDMFYVYGSEDDAFLVQSKRYITSHKALNFYSMLRNHLFDYSDILKKKLHLTLPISLVKALQFYTEREITQEHNALDDARMLKELYDLAETTVVSESRIKALLPNNYIAPVISTKINQFNSNGEFIQTFPSYSSVCRWIKDKNNLPKKKNLNAKIRSAVKTGDSYYGFIWRKAE